MSSTSEPTTGTPDPARQVVKRALQRALPRFAFMVEGPSTACLYPTFDDGPDPVHTPAVLDALRATGARATFFVVGERAARHPDVVRRIVAEGHTLGHHSYHHGAPESTSARALAEEIDRTRRVLRDITGQAPRLFRPPYGKLTASKLAAIWTRGQTVVLWSSDPRDFAGGDAAEIARRLPALHGGEIVLLHDVHPMAAALVTEIARRGAQSGLRLQGLGPSS